MNLNKYTEKAQEAIIGSQNLASEQNNSEVTPEHLLVALVEQEGGIVPSILRKMNIDPAKVQAEARALLKNLPQAYGGDVRLSPRMKLIFDSAEAEAKRLEIHTFVRRRALQATQSFASVIPRFQAALMASNSLSCMTSAPDLLARGTPLVRDEPSIR